MRLAQYLMSKEAQEILVAENAWPSVRDDALGEVPEEQQQTFDAIQAALQSGWYRPNVAYWPDVDEAINQAIQQIMVNGQAVQSTLDGLHDQIEKAAQRREARSIRPVRSGYRSSGRPERASPEVT